MNVSQNRISLIVDRSEWRQHRIIEAPVPEPSDGEVRLRVDRFALTSNNISYAVAGDFLGYWDFFPTGEEGWGRIPVMGFGDVIASRHSDVPTGTRVFGFFPMSTHLQIPVGKASPIGFVDSSRHRAQHAPAYVQFSNVAHAPMYDAAHEDHYMLLRGLFATSFLADDFLADKDFVGATSVIVTSASSKTAIALAFQLSRREGIEAIGLTSKRNADFVESLALYDRVITYDQIESLPSDVTTVVVDMAGNGEVTSRIHKHFGSELVHDCTIGATHWEKTGTAEADLPGAAPEFFFAPSQIQKRSAEWGADELQERIATDYRRFIESTNSWLDIQRGNGPDSVESVYRKLLAGDVDPRRGHILSMWKS